MPPPLARSRGFDTRDRSISSGCIDSRLRGRTRSAIRDDSSRSRKKKEMSDSAREIFSASSFFSDSTRTCGKESLDGMYLVRVFDASVCFPYSLVNCARFSSTEHL